MSKERPMIFQAWGVRSIRNMKRGVWPAEPIDPLKPIKSQTRRVLRLRKNWVDAGITHDDIELSGFWVSHCLNCPKCQALPEDEYCGQKDWQYGDEFLPQQYHVGDILVVRETHYRLGRWVKDGRTKTGRQRWRFKHATGKHVRYMDDPPTRLGKKRGVTRNQWWKRPSIFMPRWASREQLLLKEVRLERVQEIQGYDIMAEGIGTGGCADDYAEDHAKFVSLWGQINEARGFGWKVNPHVWVLTYQRT